MADAKAHDGADGTGQRREESGAQQWSHDQMRRPIARRVAEFLFELSPGEGRFCHVGGERRPGAQAGSWICTADLRDSKRDGARGAKRATGGEGYVAAGVLRTIAKATYAGL